MIDNFWSCNYTFMCSCLFTAYLCRVNIIFELRGGNFSMANQPKKYKKFVATAATATLVASAIVPAAFAAEFKDVTGNDHEVAINALSKAGIINGYADSTFKPNQTINRGQVVKILGRWLEAQGQEIPADWKTEQRFSDLALTAEEELVQYAALAKDAGVFAGSNGKLNYTQNMQRQQMAVVIVRAIKEIAGVDLVAEYKEKGHVTEISDLDKAFSAEQRNAIVALEYAGITNVSNFRPADSVTRGQFASFLYRTIENVLNAETETEASVKAINNTTVEVTFEEEVTDVKALDFAIEGLEISNAAVKQTNKKVVVLTTSAQTADVEYTVTLDGEKIGTFKGLSAVLPTTVELVSSSVQGKLGQQVTVKAQVTVAEGASKAGIPVTLFVPGSADGIKAPVTVEALTDANGVATHTYTRYAATNDVLTVYATGDRSKFSTGYVFWGVDTILAIEEVTTGATINNGANKTYKVTYKNEVTGKPEANKTFNVGFVENMNVTSDKVANATVNGVAALQLSNNTALAAAKITTDSKGEATFTVSGANTAVTPVVFAPNTTTGEKAELYKASALQATTAKVTFGALQAEYTIEVNREGGEVAARGVANGREYKVIVKDKDGKLAKNEVVNVAFNEDLDRVIGTNTDAKFIEVDKDDNQNYYPATSANGKNNEKQISVKTNDKGEATFVIGSEKENDYATPVAWIDINTSNAKQGNLDEGEPKTVAPISYFQNAYLDGASIKSYKSTNFNKVETKFDGDEIATFRAELVNQSNKKIANTSIKKVTYTIFNTGANDVKVGNATISPNRSLTVTYDSPNTDLRVISVDGKTTSVKVNATGVAINTDGKDYAFTSKEASATFTSTTDVAKEFTGQVVAVSKTEIEFEHKSPISLKDAKFYDLSGAVLYTAEDFMKALVAHVNAVVTYTEDKDGNKSFRVARTTGSIVVNAAPVLTTAEITQQPGAVSGVAASSDTISLVGLPKLTIGAKSYSYNVNATASDVAIYKDQLDLISKINNDTNTHGVTATADSAGIKLIGKSNGEAFSYQVDSLTPVRVDNGSAGSGSVSAKQQITFTFTASVNVSAGELVQVDGVIATVVKAEANKVVVEFGSPKSGTVNAITVQVDGVWTDVKSPLSGKKATISSIMIN